MRQSKMPKNQIGYFILYWLLPLSLGIYMQIQSSPYWMGLMETNYKEKIDSYLVMSYIPILCISVLIVFFLFLVYSENLYIGYIRKKLFGFMDNDYRTITKKQVVFLLAPCFLTIFLIILTNYINFDNTIKEYDGECIIRYREGGGRNRTIFHEFISKDGGSYEAPGYILEQYDPAPYINGERKCTIDSIRFKYLDPMGYVLIDTISPKPETVLP